MLEEIKKTITKKVEKARIPPRVLLSKFKFIDEKSRYSNACLDPYYMPFYYYLGDNLKVDSVLEIGFGLGLNAACYFMGNPKVKDYLAIQEPPEVFYSARLGIANVRKVWKNKFYVHVGKLFDKEFVEKMKKRKWELCLISDKKEYDTHMFWLHTIWEEMKENGIICMDYSTSHDQAKRAYHDFCVVKNRQPFVFPTRYGVGVIVR